MALMTRTEKLSVGVDILDEHHKRLVALLNELHDSMRAGNFTESLGRIVNNLVQ